LGAPEVRGDLGIIRRLFLIDGWIEESPDDVERRLAARYGVPVLRHRDPAIAVHLEWVDTHCGNRSKHTDLAIDTVHPNII
jgi:hypothetical protein